MHAVDVVALVMLVCAAVAFALGGSALARADDLVALYWLIVGLVTMRASVQIAKSGARA